MADKDKDTKSEKAESHDSKTKTTTTTVPAVVVPGTTRTPEEKAEAARVAADESNKGSIAGPVPQKASQTPDPAGRDKQDATHPDRDAARKAEVKRMMDLRPPDQADIAREADALEEQNEKTPLTPEEKRSGERVQPPTPVNLVISHQPGQANGPNQADQERTDRGIFKDPTAEPVKLKR